MTVRSARSVALVLAVALAGCGGGQFESEQRACPDAPSGSSPAVFDAGSGTYSAHSLSMDADKRVTFDVVRWLSGADATSAYHHDFPAYFPDQPDEPPPNDYYLADIPPPAQTAQVADDAEVLLVRLAEDSSAGVSKGSVGELPDYLAKGSADDVYWLTFSDGVVTGVCEQYRP